MRRLRFAVEGYDGDVSRLQKVSGEIVSKIAHLEDIDRLCFRRGSESILVALAEELKASS